MQSDHSLDDSFLSTEAWERDPVTGQNSRDVKRFELPSLERGKLSFSGSERNHLFLNKLGREFQDVSSISGLDSPQDSRTFAIWDYDRDGWQDIALANINTPVLSIFRNQLGTSRDNSLAKRAVIALQFVGGNSTERPSSQFSCRDGYGVKATFKLADQTFVRELRCGEGLAAQNTKTMLFGVSENEVVDLITIQWPSGLSQRLEQVRANELVKVFENPVDSEDGTGFERSQYTVASQKNAWVKGEENQRLSAPGEPTAKLVIYTSMATWCPSCKKHLPQLNRLREYFSADAVEFRGVPIDASETDEQLIDYCKKNQPPYKLDGQWPEQAREDFQQLVSEKLQSNILPATIVTNQRQQVLAVLPGVPTVSEIARLLRQITTATAPAVTD